MSKKKWNPLKRLCQICGKQLSRMNKEKVCFCHQIGMIIHRRSPVTSCTSYDHKVKERPNRPGVDEVYLQPGDEGYDELAFSKEVAGIVDTDGSLYELDLDEDQL